jgi:hypothetical protein
MAVEIKDDDAITQVLDSELIADGDKETSYALRTITLEKNREIVKRHTRKVPNKRTHQMEDKVDWEGVTDDLLDWALADWSGVIAHGKPLECTLPNKKRLDGVRRSAILERSGMNEVRSAPEVREESFRAPADVR